MAYNDVDEGDVCIYGCKLVILIGCLLVVRVNIGDVDDGEARSQALTGSSKDTNTSKMATTKATMAEAMLAVLLLQLYISVLLFILLFASESCSHVMLAALENKKCVSLETSEPTLNILPV